MAYFAIAFAPIAIAWVLTVSTMSAERERAFTEGAEQARRTAVFFERHVLALFRYADQHVRAARLAYSKPGGLDAVREYLAAVPLDRSLISHVTIIDANGAPVLNSAHELRPGVSVADRQYFGFHRDGEGDRVYVSLPHRGRNSDKLVLRLVRRLETPAGEFGGVVFAAIEAETITSFLDAMSLGPNSSATLVGLNKRVLARSSYGPAGPAQDISGSRLWDELARAGVGLYEQLSVVDGVVRQYAYRRLTEYPVVVAIGVSSVDIEGAVSRTQAPTYAIAGLVTVLVLAMTVLLWREVRSNRRLEASEAHVRTVVETVQDGIVTIDSDGLIESCNSSVHAMFGYEPADMIGARASMLVGEQERARLDRYLREPDDSRAGAGPGYRQVTARRADGVEFPAELAIGEIRRAGGSTFVGTIRDVTERVHAEETIRGMRDQLAERVEERTAELEAVQAELLDKQRLVVLGELTGTVAHELRNPLSAIANSTAVLERRVSALDARTAETFARLQRNVVRCNSIITELLDFTRARGLERRPTELDRWLANVLDELVLPSGIVLRRRLDAPGVEVALDRERLRRAVVNLVDNARDAVLAAGRAGDEPAVEVTSRVLDDQVEIVVADRGTGIPPELLAKVHEPLFSTKSFGVGLGLPVVRRVMEEHGGGFRVTSNPGGGTRAVLVLPRAAPQPRENSA